MTDSHVQGSARVWDLAIRLTHWSFVLLIPALWWTAENSEMGWHKRIGLVMLALLVFRILWGFFGSSTARFSHVLSAFRPTPGVLRTGHSLTGWLSTVVLIAAMLLQVTTGLFAGDPYDGATGYLNDHVKAMTAGTLTEIHHFFFNALVALIVVHIGAVLFYAVVKKERLVPPMITGKAKAAPGMEVMQPVPAWRAIACLAVGAALAVWVSYGAPGL